MQKKSTFIISIIFCALLSIGIMALIWMYSRKQQLNAEKIDEYLYSIEVENYSYKMVANVIKNTTIEGACTTFRKGNLVGRNLDWIYDNNVELIVKTPHDNGRYATIGVASLSEIDKSILENNKYDIMLDFMPFYVVDGINEEGLVVCTNMVPSGDAGYTTGTNPGGEKVSSAILARYLLDYAKDCDEAIELTKKANIYALVSDGEPFELHLLVSDKNRTIAIELIENEVVIIEDQNILTNFYVGLDDYTPHAQGIERYEIIEELYPTLSDIGSFFNALKKTYFSNYYDIENYKWYSDCYGDTLEDGTFLSINSDKTVLDDFMQIEHDEYLKRTRFNDYEIWISRHTTVYDIDTLTMYIKSEEGETIYSFTLNN